MKTDQERSEALFKLRKLQRDDEDIRMMCDMISAQYGGLNGMVEQVPELFDEFAEEVESIVFQIEWQDETMT